MTPTPESAPAAGGRRAAVIFILVTVALDMLAFGVVIPVLPKLVASFYEGNMSRAAAIYGWFGFAFMLAQFLCSPLQGALSDRFGRRPVILLSNLGLALDFVLMAVAQTLPLLFIGRVIAGITSASFTTASAYIADVTPPERRAQAFGMIGAAFGLGFILGPALAAVFAGYGERVPFWIAAALAFANFLYGALILPESLPKERRGAFRWSRANPVGSLKLLRGHPELFGLAAVAFLSHLAHMVYPSTFVLYADYRYGWDERTVGFTLAAVGVLAAVIQGGLIRRIVVLMGERRMLLFGLLMGAAGTLGYGLAPVGWLMWAAMPIAAFWGVAQPAMQTVMTQRIDPTEQGRLQGALMSVAAIAGILGPLAFTGAFSAMIAPARAFKLPGTPFLLASLILAVAAFVAWRVTRKPYDAVAAPATP